MNTRQSARAGCRLTPEQTEGPFYVDVGLNRRDITEGKEGLPLELELTVESAENCEPLPNATVEVWHCDALGLYSGFRMYRPAELANSSREVPEDSDTFLRGAQMSDDSGKVVFRTVYPGWYPGRTTHIHFKVRLNGMEIHTGQMYFDDRITDAVYKQRPYAVRPNRDTTNDDDGLFWDGGAESMLSLTAEANGYKGAMKIVVRA